jgi:hypothetical protein
MIFWSAMWWSDMQKSSKIGASYNSGSWSLHMGLSQLYTRGDIFNITEGFYSVRQSE